MKPFSISSNICLYLSCILLLASNVASWTTVSKSFSYRNSLAAKNSDDEIRDPSSFSQEELQAFLDEMSEKQKSPTLNDDENTWMKTEQDFKIYADLLREMETSGEEGIYSNILNDLNSSSDVDRDNFIIPPAVADADSQLVDDDIPLDDTFTASSVLDDADGIGETVIGKTENTETNINEIIDPFTETDEMMKRALQEALIEVKKNSPLDPSTDPKSILNDKEMMKELNAIFNRANEQLLASISEIRKEQDALSKATATSRTLSIETEERRLAEAEESISRLVNKVRQETQEVEKAVSNLKDAQDKMSSDPLLQAAVLKRAGLFKQAALIGGLLFTFRSLGDLGAILSSIGSPSDGSIANHGYAAAIQGIIALICTVYFKFF